MEGDDMGKKKLESTEMLITPALAAKWLETVSNNRSVSETTVAKYTSDMKADRWWLTGQPIIFDVNGRLIDGQHRLWAIVTAQASVRMMVVEGADPEAIHAIDTGRVRGVGTVLGLLGVTNANRTAAVATMVATVIAPTQKGMSVGEVQKVMNDHRGIAWIMGQPEASSTKTFAIAPVLGAFALAWEHDKEFAARAWEQFRTGADLSKGDPLLTMRNVLLNHDSCSGSAQRRSLIRKMLSALAYKMQGRPMLKSQDGIEGVKVFVGVRAAKRNEAGSVEATP
jgi:hypothetical protein